MSSREDILQSIRSASAVKYNKPDLDELEANALTYDNLTEQFCNIMKQVGGEAISLEKETDINKLISSLYPGNKSIASNIPEITCATFNPDDIDNPADLNGTNVAVIRAKVGVAENGAVWIEQDVKHRALYFISEELVVLLDRKNIVNNMHEAYRLIDTGSYGFGTFISGPSKTADIEQALVMGAHGARVVKVILI